MLAALEAGLHPIICVGETPGAAGAGHHRWSSIALQVKTALAGVPAEKLRKCVIAYEPVWAIGTGKTATAEQAGEVCTVIRTTIRRLYGARSRPQRHHPVRRLHEALATRRSCWPSRTSTAA